MGLRFRLGFIRVRIRVSRVSIRVGRIKVSRVNKVTLGVWRAQGLQVGLV